eukprot:2526406-Rhodomonas_salina.1
MLLRRPKLLIQRLETPGCLRGGSSSGDRKTQDGSSPGDKDIPGHVRRDVEGLRRWRSDVSDSQREERRRGRGKEGGEEGGE